VPKSAGGWRTKKGLPASSEKGGWAEDVDVDVVPLEGMWVKIFPGLRPGARAASEPVGDKTISFLLYDQILKRKAGSSRISGETRILSQRRCQRIENVEERVRVGESRMEGRGLPF
jgi:hypothetical protein